MCWRSLFKSQYFRDFFIFTGATNKANKREAGSANVIQQQRHGSASGSRLTVHGLREDELQEVFGPVFGVLQQLIHAVPPVQERLPALPGQRHLPPALHDDRVLAAGKLG